MKSNKNSIDILKELLRETICYVTFRFNGLIYTKPVTQSKFFYKKSLIDTDDYLEVYNVVDKKIFKLNINDIITFKYKNDLKKTSDVIEQFKTNLENFKKQHIQNLSDEILYDIVFIDKCIYEENGVEKQKDLFFSKNLYLIKFSDFVNITSISELTEFLKDGKLILNKLKQKWISEISKSKESALKFVDDQISELNVLEDNDIDFLNSLHEIKQSIIDYDYATEINNLKTVNEVLSTWPTLFLPAPDFTNYLNEKYRYDIL